MRRAAVAGVTALLATVLAGCSSSGGSVAGSSAPSSPPTPSSSSAPSSSAAPTATVTDTVSVPPSSSASGSSAQAGPTKCTNSDLSISASEGNGASEHNRYILYFHNTSSSACVLQGYPGLDALAASGSVLAHATRTPSGFMGGSRHGSPAVPIAVSKYASAIVEWANIQPGTGDACYKQSARIAVTAANTTRAVVLDRSVTACSLQIHPTVPGRTGDLT